ncbi:MAG: SpoIID/LytB domain-containing protein, partial [Chloroflexota bacterium]
MPVTFLDRRAVRPAVNARRRRRPLALGLAALALLATSSSAVASEALSVGLAPAARVTPTAVAPLPASFSFSGRGWGHGVGMSQWGARGRAEAGQTAAQILVHYFPGTTLGSVNAGTQVRVLVYAATPPTSTAPLRVVGRGGTWAIDGLAKSFPADAVLRAWQTTVTSSSGTTVKRWALQVKSTTGSVLYSGKRAPDIRVRPTASATQLQLDSKPTTYDTYRGVLRLVLTGRVTVVNELPLDLYLRGVVPIEMPPSWPTAALRAQAIAARGYAFRRLHPTTGLYDLYDDSRSQVYRGVRGESSVANAAIAATAGRVVKSGSAVANTMFHSTGGGATENNENVFVSSTGRVVAAPVSYLRGSLDRDASGHPYDRGSPHYAWHTATYTPVQLGTILGHDSRTSVGALKALDLSARGVSGRLIRV